VPLSPLLVTHPLRVRPEIRDWHTIVIQGPVGRKSWLIGESYLDARDATHLVGVPRIPEERSMARLAIRT
jgi:hypothetical protein